LADARSEIPFVFEMQKWIERDEPPEGVAEATRAQPTQAKLCGFSSQSLVNGRTSQFNAITTRLIDTARNFFAHSPRGFRFVNQNMGLLPRLTAAKSSGPIRRAIRGHRNEGNQSIPLFA
jgi:hypothetical protein